MYHPRRLSFILLLVLSAGARGAEPATDALGPLRYAAPRGWPRGEATDRNARVYLAPTGDAVDQATVVIALGEARDPADFDFRQQFGDWIARTLVGMEVTPRGQPRSGTNRQGLKSLAVNVVGVNGADRKTYARFIAFAWNGRIVGFCLTSTSQKLLEQYQGDLDRLAAGAVIEAKNVPRPPERKKVEKVVR